MRYRPHHMEIRDHIRPSVRLTPYFSQAAARVHVLVRHKTAPHIVSLWGWPGEEKVGGGRGNLADSLFGGVWGIAGRCM